MHRGKDCCSQRGGSGHRGRGRGRGSSPPPTQGSPTDHRLTNECHHSAESASEETSSDTGDQLDATTQRRSHGTPPTTSHPPLTPPPHTTPPKPYTKTSPYTSGQTQCRPRTTSSPVKEKPKDELQGEAQSTDKSSHRQGPAPVLLILLVLLVLVGIYSTHNAFNKVEEKASKRPPKPIADVYADLKIELRTLNREFSQPRELWLGLLGQLEAVMVDEPLQPAVFLLVVPDDSKGAATCLAHRLARAIQYAFEDSRFLMYDTRSSEYQDTSALLKVELDDTLKGLAQAHVAVVHNVESIPGPAAMILHAYCDNDNAPFKQTIIFLLAEIPGTYAELGYLRLDSVVDSHLGHMWGAGLAEKDVSALISRTCNAPILVRPERSARVLEMCPL